MPSFSYVRQVVPLVHLLRCRAQVVVDVLEVDVGHVVGEPLGHRLAVEDAEAAQAVLRHPLRLALPPADLLDHAVAETLLGVERVLHFIAPAEAVLAEVEIEGAHGDSSCRGSW
jgi:hypothetical protein